MTDTPASTLFTLALLIAGAVGLSMLATCAADKLDAVLPRKDDMGIVARRGVRSPE